jgi:transcriptional regulator with XRE-family HTH domain
MGRSPKPIDPSESLSALVGWKIRSLRESRGWTQPELGSRISCTGDHVSKLELGTRAPDLRVAELLDATFGTAPYFKEHQPVLAKDRIPGPARNLADHEETAATIQVYVPMLIPGLLQTEEYARAVVLAGPNADGVDEIVAERMRRQSILDRKNPPRCWPSSTR